MTVSNEGGAASEGAGSKPGKVERREAHRQARHERRRKRRTLVTDIFRILFIALLFVAAGLILPRMFDVEKLKDLLHPDATLGGRLKSYIIFVTVAAVLQSVGFFRWVVCVAAGGIYGAAIGIVVSMISSLLGAFGTYYLGSTVLGGVARRRLKGRHIEKWKAMLLKHPFTGTLYMRLFPGSSAVMTGVICGTCRIDLKAYFLANFVGFLPQTLIFSIFGSGATKAKTEQILLGIGLFILVCLVQWYLARFVKRRRDPDYEALDEVESS